MERPNDIPEDIWDVANSVCWKWANDDPPLIEEAMARAIMAERERCAQKAEAFRNDNPFPTVNGAIASAIRSGA